VRLKDRLLSACAGFGFVSKSRRDAACCSLLPSRIPCADWIAVANIRRQSLSVAARDGGTTDLRIHLRDVLRNQPRRRRRFALRLGDALARLHNTGFDHRPVLQAYFVDEDGPQILLPGCATLAKTGKCLGARRGAIWRRSTPRSARTFSLRMTTRLLACVPSGLPPCRQGLLRACAAGSVSNCSHTRHLLSQRRIQETRQGPRPHLPGINWLG